MDIRKFALWFILLNVLDLGMTTISLSIYGPAVEVNPLARMFYVLGDFWGLMALKAFLIITAIWAVDNVREFPMLQRALGVFAFFVLTVAIWSNIFIVGDFIARQI